MTRSPTLLLATALAGLLAAADATALTGTGTLRIRVPVFQSKTKTKGGLSTTSYKPLKEKNPFLLDVLLYDGPPSPNIPPTVIHSETIRVVPDAGAASPDPSAGVQRTADKVEGAVDVVLGAQPGQALPADLFEQRVWLSTRVVPLHKKTGTPETAYEAIPLRPLGLDGVTRGQDITPRSLTLDTVGGGLQLTADAGTGLALVSDAAGNARWRQVDTAGLATDSVTAAQIAQGAVASSEVANESLTGADVADGSLAGIDIQNGSLTGTDVADGSLTGSDVADGSITGADVADASLTGADVADESITADDIADQTITANELGNQAVNTNHIVPNAVNASRVLDGTLTGLDVADGSLTGQDIEDASLSGADIADNTLTGADIVDGFLTGDDIAPGSLTGEHLGLGTVGSLEIEDGSITGDDVAAGTLTGAHIETGTITSANVQNGSILGQDIGFDAITSSQIGPNAVGSSELYDFIDMTDLDILDYSDRRMATASYLFGGGYLATYQPGLNQYGVPKLTMDVGFLNNSGLTGGLLTIYDNSEGVAVQLQPNGNIYNTGSGLTASPDMDDPTVELRYKATLSPEAGTSIRGTATLEAGYAEIELPAHFESFTSPDGLTVQVTPRGRCAGLYVESVDLERVVVRELVDWGSTVEFDWLVQGTRRGFEDEPIFAPNTSFLPQGATWADQVDPRHVPAMISNGILHPDGTVDQRLVHALREIAREQGLLLQDERNTYDAR